MQKSLTPYLIYIALIYIILHIPLSFIYAQTEQSIEFSKYSDSIEVSRINISYTDSLYDFIEQELTFIDFDDCNNCDSRAHIMAAILEKNFPGVKIAKVWLFADFKRASKFDYYRYKKDVFLNYKDKCSLWGFHVAPIVIIEHGGTVDTIVIDHSTQPAPVKLSQWAASLVQKEGRGFIVIKDKKYLYYPDDEHNKFEDTKIEWIDDEKKQLYDEDYSRSLEKVLISKYGFWEPWTYRKHYNELKKLLEKDQ